MQQQPRRAQPAPVVQSKTTPHAEMKPVCNAPIELDLEQLAHVAGGDTVTAPKKFW